VPRNGSTKGIGGKAAIVYRDHRLTGKKMDVRLPPFLFYFPFFLVFGVDGYLMMLFMNACPMLSPDRTLRLLNVLVWLSRFTGFQPAQLRIQLRFRNDFRGGPAVGSVQRSRGDDGRRKPAGSQHSALARSSPACRPGHGLRKLPFLAACVLKFRMWRITRADRR